jgi:hypothetical protein
MQFPSPFGYEFQGLGAARQRWQTSRLALLEKHLLQSKLRNFAAQYEKKRKGKGEAPLQPLVLHREPLQLAAQLAAVREEKMRTKAQKRQKQGEYTKRYRSKNSTFFCF